MKAVRISLIILIGLIPYLSPCQSAIGFSYGATQYRGDMSDDNAGYFSNLKLAYGCQYNFKWNNRFSTYCSFIKTSMSASDLELNNPSLKQRNLHFKSTLEEIGVGIEIYPMAFLSKKNLIIEPFLTTGVALFHFNPQAQYQGKWYDLQPLHTEGQGMPKSGLTPYSTYDIAHPFGIGVKINISKNLNFKFEFTPRNTNTDFLDDISGNYYDLNNLRKYSSDEAAKLSYNAIDWSLENLTLPDVNGMQRGNPNNDDWYIIQKVTFFYSFNLSKPVSSATAPTIEPAPSL